MPSIFEDRTDAGRQLAERLSKEHSYHSPLVLGLPRGGVPVAHEVALRLQAELDILVVRKLGVPSHTELAMGAIAAGGVRYLNQSVIDGFNISPDTLERVEVAERQELTRRLRKYRGDRPYPMLEGREILLVDDGIATGATMMAGVLAIRESRPKSLTVAVPVSPPDAVAAFSKVADHFIALEMPVNFMAVGYWYRNFSQTSDAEVVNTLTEFWSGGSA